MKNPVLCEACGKEFPEEDTEQCLCGVPFCYPCFDKHNLDCEAVLDDQAVFDAGIYNAEPISTGGTGHE